MIKRTTIELDQELLSRAKEALGETTTRATVEEALRRMADKLESDRERLVAKQRRYLQALGSRADLGVLAADEMWR